MVRSVRITRSDEILDRGACRVVVPGHLLGAGRRSSRLVGKLEDVICRLYTSLSFQDPQEIERAQRHDPFGVAYGDLRGGTWSAVQVQRVVAALQ